MSCIVEIPKEKLSYLEVFIKEPKEYVAILADLSKVIKHEYKVALSNYIELATFFKNCPNLSYTKQNFIEIELEQVNHIYDVINDVNEVLQLLYENKAVLSSEIHEAILGLWLETRHVCSVIEEMVYAPTKKIKRRIMQELEGKAVV